MSVRRAAAVAATVAALVLGVVVAGPAGAATDPGTPVPTPVPTRPLVPPPPPKPAVGVTVKVTPSSGALVGVAYPITARFSTTVGRKASAERAMKVYVGSTLVRGAWSWKDGRTAVFRPLTFWPGRQRVVVRMTLAGVVLAENSTTQWVGTTASTRLHGFRTGRALVAKVDNATHRMTVTIDGTRVRIIPVSLGKTGFITRSGVKAVMEKYLVRTMTSQALGITDPADQYEVHAPYAVRITSSGEFVHGAPWANYRIGKFNGSHGCTNIRIGDAQWFYSAVLPGDPVVTVGTGRGMEPWNGTGGPWNIAWSTWLSHSATKGQVA